MARRCKACGSDKGAARAVAASRASSSNRVTSLKADTSSHRTSGRITDIKKGGK